MICVLAMQKLLRIQTKSQVLWSKSNCSWGDSIPSQSASSCPASSASDPARRLLDLEAADDSSSAWLLPPSWETRVEFLQPSFKCPALPVVGLLWAKRWVENLILCLFFCLWLSSKQISISLKLQQECNIIYKTPSMKDYRCYNFGRYIFLLSVSSYISMWYLYKLYSFKFKLGERHEWYLMIFFT